MEKIECFKWHYAKENEHRKYKLKTSKKMIRDICKLLKERLQFQGDLPFIDVYAGLAQTVSYKEQDENGNPVTKKMPVSYDTNIEDCGFSPEKAVVPDSSKKGIIYFEENGGATQYKRLAGNFTMWKAQIVLICWLNRDKITGDAYSEIATKAFSDISLKLKNDSITSPFTKVIVDNTRFRQDANLFTKYSYETEVLQFLRPPYEFFAIDLSVNFTLKGNCLPSINLTPNNC